ncbi:MAG: hypothetical protein HC837_01540 [Chloroflexaceae bacterium]|nr:hypothetical protein [Chloroflexaceae bacterium]
MRFRILVFVLVGMLVFVACGQSQPAAEPTTAPATTAAEADDPEAEPTETDEPEENGGSSATGSEDWIEFSSEEGGFTVMMPGTPEEGSQDVGTDAGQMGLATYQFTTDAAAYTVMFSDFPEDMIGAVDPQELLLGGQEGALTSLDGELISEREVDLDGYPGREIVAEAQVGGIDAILKGRFYLVDNRLYQTLVIGQQDAVDEEDIDYFLDSFSLNQ